MGLSPVPAACEPHYSQMEDSDKITVPKKKEEKKKNPLYENKLYQ